MATEPAHATSHSTYSVPTRHLLQDLRESINHLRTREHKVPSEEETATRVGHWLHDRIVSIARAVQRRFKKAAEGRPPWRKAMGTFLESKEIHVILLLLLLVDLVAVVVDILISLHSKAKELDECIDLLTLCQETPSACETLHPGAESKVPFYISISVLSIFLLDLALLFLAWGLAFFTHPGYILDLFVMTTALVLECTLDSDVASLLALLTLWRLVRVMHGIFEVTDKTFHAELRKMEKLVEVLQSQHEQDQRQHEDDLKQHKHDENQPQDDQKRHDLDLKQHELDQTQLAQDKD